MPDQRPEQPDPNLEDAVEHLPSAETAAGGGEGGAGAASAGVQFMHSHLMKEPKGFWEDAWSQVLRRPGAVAGLTWVGIVAFFAVFSPLIANGHPLILRHLDENGRVVSTSYPLFTNLSSIDVMLIIGGVVFPVLFMLKLKWKRSERLMAMFFMTLQAGLILFIAERVAAYVQRPDVADWVREMERNPRFAAGAAGLIALLITLAFFMVPIVRRRAASVTVACIVGVVSWLVVANFWTLPLQTFPYLEMEANSEVSATYTLIPFSPHQRRLEMRMLEPGASERTRHDDPSPATLDDGRPSGPKYILGTDSRGQDVMSQLLHACRLSISIGLVSTGIAVIIGVTMGALMGYFGGWVDMLLYRVVEVFMAIPVLFLLIVAAAVLQPNIYVMMAIIGCVAWTGAARFTRAEFYRLRDQDFVQAARAVGLPLRSVLFRHMLPNGVTPVLVDASFAIAVAIQIEATLSFLLLGPTDQPSWGRLLADAIGEVGDFVWWIAIFPGLAIFLTVLSIVLVGEALRDAIDPKLKKAAQA